MTLFGRQAGLGAIILAVAGLCACDRAGGRDADTPSGFPVPRYVSLNFNEAAGRAGPSEEHRIVAVYRAKGMPVQVVAETAEWKRICDPFGGQPVWMKNRLITGARTVIRLKPGAAGVYKRPSEAAPVVAWLPPKSIAAFDRCEKGWCRVKVGGVKGWTPEADIWGTAPEPQCRG